MSKKTKGTLMLLTTAFIWGTAFVAQRDGMNYIGPFTFNGLRSYIAFFSLIPVVLLFQKKKTQEKSNISKVEYEKPRNSAADKKFLIKGGVLCGIILFFASTIQQYGLIYTTAGKGGFITALYIVLVPIYGLFLGKKVRPLLWFCVILAITGLYLLTMKEDLSINKGDIMVMVCSFLFATHIVVIDYFSPRTDGLKMSWIQFLVVAILSTPCIIIFENVDWQNVLNCIFPMLYAGIFSGGVAYTLQILAQKDTEPTVASLILSLESVFAVIAGIILLGESISMREFLGCVIIFVAIILAQLPSKKHLDKIN